MINHSDLTKMLLDLERHTPIKDVPILVGKIIRESSAGVIKEGGPLAASILPENHVSLVFEGFRPQMAAPTIVVAPPAPESSGGTGFVFGKTSKGNLEGVQRTLIECATLALMKYTTQDFMVFEGLRTEARQRKLVATGMSRTMQSKHLSGHALDLVPIIDGIPKWDWLGCAKIAFAMDQAATELKCAHRIVWGGAWDRTLADFGGVESAYLAEVEAYKRRHAGSDFIDGPHFQIN